MGSVAPRAGPQTELSGGVDAAAGQPESGRSCDPRCPCDLFILPILISRLSDFERMKASRASSSLSSLLSLLVRTNRIERIRPHTCLNALVTKATRAFVRERAKSRCEYCRAPEIITGGPFEVDHIVPQASAGGDEPENLALCCKSCNVRKGDHISGVDPGSREDTLLFNPRQEGVLRLIK
jgi:HNH endonuclease